jgi:hypothetical protein
LEYLLHLAPVSNVSHTVQGLFLFCLPAGLIALWLLQIWKLPILSILGNEYQGAGEIQKAPFNFRAVRRAAIICLAVLIGALTHLLWDSFTHQYGWMVQHQPALATPMLKTRWGTVPLFKFFQHGSTIFGLTVLAVVASRHRTRFKMIPRAAWRMASIVLCLSGTLALACSFIRFGFPVDFGTLARFIGVSIVEVFVIVIVEITMISLVWHTKRQKS